MTDEADGGNGAPGTGWPVDRLMDGVETGVFAGFGKLKELRLAHRSLDEAIAELSARPAADQLELRRLKKRKLRLKDMITRLESERIPDLEA
jgi:hypothetical protein